MADLFRKSSIEKLSNPEQLDKAIEVSSPLSWLALTGVAMIIAAVIVWGFRGTLPSAVSVEGVITNPIGSAAIYADVPGVISAVLRDAGDQISEGTAIAEIKTFDGTIETIKAEHEGVLVGDVAKVGTQIFPGGEIARYTPALQSEQLAVCYIPVDIVGQIREGMRVQVYLNGENTRKLGHMEAKIKIVEDYPVNTSSLRSVLGTDNLIIDRVLSGGAVVSVICEIEKDGKTASGFYWSNEKGEETTVKNGALLSARIIVEECRPINKLIGSVADGLEG